MSKKASQSSSFSTAKVVRTRVENGGARLWKHDDFRDLPPTAVAKALSRLKQGGELKHVAKGVYYHPEQTSFGPSVASSVAVTAGTVAAGVYPAGLSAANELGLTTQNPRRTEFATVAPAVPRALRDFVVHTDRPASRESLSREEGALMEVLRDRAKTSDLSPDQTANRLLRLLDNEQRFKRMARAALFEPPRVRAMLGALGEELNMPARSLDTLKQSLNPLSRYDFGVLRSLRFARDWQAK